MKPDESWLDRALCAEVSIDFWFSRRDDPSFALARRVCRMCPVTTECLEYALDNEIPHGIWGGLGPRSRQKLAKARAAA